MEKAGEALNPRLAGVQEVYAAAERKAIPLYERIGFTLTETEMFLELEPLESASVQ